MKEYCINIKAALRAAHQIASKKPFSFVLVQLFDEIRTFFERN